MSYASLISSSASVAQSILAAMVDPVGDGKFYFNADPTTFYNSIIPAAETSLVPTTTGLEYRASLRITATRSQFATAPNASSRPKLTALGETWTLVNVTLADAHYVLTCVPGS